jgi:hypothetical protein
MAKVFNIIYKISHVKEPIKVFNIIDENKYKFLNSDNHETNIFACDINEQVLYKLYNLGNKVSDYISKETTVDEKEINMTFILPKKIKRYPTFSRTLADNEA